MAETVEYYLSRGFDRKTAEYFAGGRKKAVSVRPNPDFTLTILFDNGEERVYDCKPLLERGTVFEPFLLYDNFRRVYLDENHAVSWDMDPNKDSRVFWDNKVDISPDTCYMDSVPGSDARL